MPIFLSITSFEPRIVSYLVSYLFSLMDMGYTRKATKSLACYLLVRCTNPTFLAGSRKILEDKSIEFLE